jgi:hypothetical protein
MSSISKEAILARTLLIYFNALAPAELLQHLDRQEMAICLPHYLLVSKNILRE